jgi:hypothetical protein
VVSLVPALSAGSVVGSAAAPAPAIASWGSGAGGVGMVDLPTGVRFVPPLPQVAIPMGWLVGW